MQRIVIVGGGAGGLALATQLGKRLGKKGLAEITLVDAARTHVWKPLLHLKAAEFLRTLGGDDPLETTRLNQLVVNGNLQSTRDGNIYAFGDCAACQQAMYLVKALPLLQQGQAVAPFVFRDQGSLVSLSEYSSVGSLMGSLTQGSFFIEGQLAKIMYRALHKQHQLALGGWKKTALITLSEMIDRTYRPRIKLH